MAPRADAEGIESQIDDDIGGRRFGEEVALMRVGLAGDDAGGTEHIQPVADLVGKHASEASEHHKRRPPLSYCAGHLIRCLVPPLVEELLDIEEFNSAPDQLRLVEG
jgi:hypothetical protein